MSGIFNKFISKIVAVFIIILFIAGFRSLLADKEFYTVFGALMGTLPFAKITTDIICNLLNYQNAVPIITGTSVFADILKLAVMACIQPFAVSVLAKIFLRLPAGSYREQEEYMDSATYKLKELVLTVFTAPLIALAASYCSSKISAYITANLGSIPAVIFGVLLTAVLIVLSVLRLLSKEVSLFTAVLWRVTVTFGAGMFTTYITSALCLFLYVALLGGVQAQIFTSIAALVVWLIIVDLGMKFLRYSVAGTNLRK